MILSSGLAPGQVLQRLSNHTASASLKGECQSRGEISAEIRCGTKNLKFQFKGKVSSGKFELQLKGIPTGGPYSLTLRIARESLVINNFWVGDVWLLAGQSNMQGCGSLDKAPKPHPMVHAMYMDRHWAIAREPTHRLNDSPDPVHHLGPFSSDEEVRVFNSVKGVGPGIFFGEEMVRRSGGVPQGLICTAHGGSNMPQWDPQKKNLGENSLYGSMMLSVRKTGQPISGVLWYQGESDAVEGSVALYSQRMKRFVTALRKDLKQPRLPFFMVQLARCMALETGLGFNPKHWNEIQFQQLNLRKQIPYLDCVPAVDLPLDDRIHLSSEGMARLGVRLARLADRMVYGNRKELPTPELVSIKSIRLKKRTPFCPHILELTFSNVMGGLQPFEPGAATGFVLIDSQYQNTNLIFKTIVRGNQIELHSSVAALNQNKLSLMYGHGTTCFVNLTDARDMAIPVFGPIPVHLKAI